MKRSDLNFTFFSVQNESILNNELVRDFNAIDESKIKSNDMYAKNELMKNEKISNLLFNDHRLNDIWKKAQFADFNNVEINQLKVNFIVILMLFF